jgi:MtN3 and saliva related transmembrane protein
LAAGRAWSIGGHAADGGRQGAVDGIEYIGVVASSLGTLAFLPQVVKTWRTRSAHDFSLTTLFMLEGGTGLWMIYGLMRGAPAIWLGNGLTFALAGFILMVKVTNGAMLGRAVAAGKAVR